ncbi:hypothetical protein [Cognatishimia sp. MH4019]|uniref:hypothetical protein n=1 Tax=Cognatishimia sp. MH4019 TaxID=2854030 RepID=UPI001CD5A898|nr:hypothetical protein [Cognatishimia sp. MH4019]
MAQVLPLFAAPEISRLDQLNAQRVALSGRIEKLAPKSHKAIALRARLAELTNEALALECQLHNGADSDG